MDDTQIDQLAVALAGNRFISSVLQRWSDIALPNVWLAAGVVTQTVSNIAHQRAPEAGIAAIATFPTTATAVGIRPHGSRLEIYAPFGLDDLLGLVVRPNKAQITQAIYESKIARWRSCWFDLKIFGWDDTPT